jgi:hypothetical protein
VDIYIDNDYSTSYSSWLVSASCELIMCWFSWLAMQLLRGSLL